MAHYIDGFVLPIPSDNVEQYQQVADKVAGIWKEHGALEYYECVGDDMHRQGTRPFTDLVAAKPNETVIFGWVVFPSREVRDSANAKVESDPRMRDLVAPLVDPSAPIFDPGRMAYGGFRTIVQSSGS